MSRLRLLAYALLTALLASPAFAYTVYLKDGSQLNAREKYRIEGAKAYLVLQNGTTTMLAAAEIDVARTEAANRSRLGNAVVLEDHRSAAPKPAPAKPKPKITEVAGSRTALDEKPLARRTTGATAVPPLPGGKTLAGYEDFLLRPRTPFGNSNLATTIVASLRANGIEEVLVHQGTNPKRPFVEITAGSEALVYRGLLASANALLEARARGADALDALEVLMVTPARARAGQFVLTPDLAAQLMNRQIDPPAFFVAHVQF